MAIFYYIAQRTRSTPPKWSVKSDAVPVDVYSSYSCTALLVCIAKSWYKLLTVWYTVRLQHTARHTWLLSQTVLKDAETSESNKDSSLGPTKWSRRNHVMFWGTQKESLRPLAVFLASQKWEWMKRSDGQYSPELERVCDVAKLWFKESPACFFQYNGKTKSQHNHEVMLLYKWSSLPVCISNKVTFVMPYSVVFVCVWSGWGGGWGGVENVIDQTGIQTRRLLIPVLTTQPCHFFTNDDMLSVANSVICQLNRNIVWKTKLTDLKYTRFMCRVGKQNKW